MGGKRKAQQKTTSRAAKSKLLKSKLLKSKASRVTCSSCGETRAVSETVSPLRIELEMRKQVPQKYNLEVGWSINAAQQGWLVWACETCLKQGRAIEAKPWSQICGYNLPSFAYFDDFRTCSDCKKDFAFSASEQAYWYETLGFIVYSKPKQCQDCRKKRRKIKQANLEIGEVMGSFEGTISQLLQLADLYEQIGHVQKSLEFVRRAKNNSRDEAEIQVLFEKIGMLEKQLQTQTR